MHQSYRRKKVYYLVKNPLWLPRQHTGGSLFQLANAIQQKETDSDPISTVSEETQLQNVKQLLTQTKSNPTKYADY